MANAMQHGQSLPSPGNGQRQAPTSGRCFSPGQLPYGHCCCSKRPACSLTLQALSWHIQAHTHIILQGSDQRICSNGAQSQYTHPQSGACHAVSHRASSAASLYMSVASTSSEPTRGISSTVCSQGYCVTCGLWCYSQAAAPGSMLSMLCMHADHK